MSGEVVLEVEGIAKSFRIPSVRRDTVREHFFGLLHARRFERLQVLEEVGFSVRRGESLGIMGRNGSGKSTLLKIVAGIYEPDRGRARRPKPPRASIRRDKMSEADRHHRRGGIGSDRGHHGQGIWPCHRTRSSARPGLWSAPGRS